MDWQVKSLSRACDHCGRSFAAGDHVVSYLHLDVEGELTRSDVLSTETGAFDPKSEIFGWWTTTVRDAEDEAAARRQAMQTTEELFLSLFEDEEGEASGVPAPAPPAAEGESPGPGGGDTRAILQFLLAIMLERKRKLKPVDRPIPGRPQRYLHRPSERVYRVPWVDVTGEAVLKVQHQLDMLVI